MQMKKLDVLHVGLPKTASTFLQKQIFSKVLGRKSITIGVQESHCIDFAYHINKLKFSDDRVGYSTVDCRNNPLTKPAKRRQWLRLIRSALSEETEPLLVSSEGLVGVSWDPLINNLEIAKFLRDGFRKCKIVFVFRRQDEWAISCYKQLVFQEDRFRKYIAFHELFGFDSNSVVHVGSLNWQKVWNNYVSVFGRENVLALPYEMLVANPAVFIQSLEAFAECSFDIQEAVYEIRENMNSELPEFVESKLHTSSNLILKKVMTLPYASRKITELSLSKPFRKYFETRICFEEIPNEYATKLLSYHQQDNRLLSDELGLSLEAYGYF